MKIMTVSLAVASVLLAACGGDSADNRAPVNQAPSITAIGDQNTVANTTSQPIAFVVTDEQAGNLQISATSDRQLLVPDGSLSLNGGGTERTLSVSPVADMTGDAFITIVVTDQGGLSASTSFLLIVGSEDDEPAFINAVEFAQDADDDDFADLLAQ